MTLTDTIHQDKAENLRLAQAIDHTKLTFAPGEDEAASIATLCREARESGFFSVCVRPRHIVESKRHLQGSPVKVATVIGFPVSKVKLDSELQAPTVGNFPVDSKVAETRQAVADGADELDLVITVSTLKADVRNGTSQTRDELLAIREAANGVPIKVIIETDLLSREEIVQVTRWCHECGMFMVKTSTGMVDGGKGATPEAVALIRETLTALQSSTGIKASGGVKTREQAIAYLDGGVDRIGTSSGVSLLRESHAGGGDGY